MVFELSVIRPLMCAILLSELTQGAHVADGGQA